MAPQGEEGTKMGKYNMRIPFQKFSLPPNSIPSLISPNFKIVEAMTEGGDSKFKNLI